MRLSWICKTWFDLCSTCQNLRSVYTVQKVPPTHCSPKTMSLKIAPTVGTLGRTYIPRTEEGWGASIWLDPILGSTSGNILLITSSNNRYLAYWYLTHVLLTVFPKLECKIHENSNICSIYLQQCAQHIWQHLICNRGSKIFAESKKYILNSVRFWSYKYGYVFFSLAAKVNKQKCRSFLLICNVFWLCLLLLS